MDWSFVLQRFKQLPFELKIALGAGLLLLLFNLLWAVNSYTAVKVDPGIATLCGAIIGLCIVAWQTSKGFSNLITSQENQAKLEREARVHQYELDEQKLERQTEREKRALVSALWAEVYSLNAQVGDAKLNAWMMRQFYDGLAKKGHRSITKEMQFPTFEAPIFRASIDKLGLLGPSIAADVVLVVSKAKGGAQIKMRSEEPWDLEFLATIYKGHEEAMDDWRADLLHVANRLRSIMDGSPDPGILFENRKKRRDEKTAATNPAAHG